MPLHVLLVGWAGTAGLGDGAVGEMALKIAHGKAQLGLGAAFARGILCNALVCLATWLAMAGRSVTDKILAILFPIAAFVALGFAHSIANWFFLPFGLVLDGRGTLSLAGVAGNLVGGTLLVAGLYWLAYLRGDDGQARPS